jgi:hypothetical protein
MIWLTWRQFRAQTAVAAAALAAFAVILGMTGPNLAHADAASGLASCRGNCNRFLATQHLRRRITYQPASRFWAFQAYETAVFVVLALALAGFCLWWIRWRRLT